MLLVNAIDLSVWDALLGRAWCKSMDVAILPCGTSDISLLQQFHGDCGV